MIFTPLFSKPYNRKKFILEVSENRFYAINTSKNTYMAIIFTLMGSLQVFSGLIEGFKRGAILNSEFILVFSFLFIVGIISFRQFLWLTRGKHEMIIENEKLTLSKKGTFFTFPKVYDINNIKDVRIIFDEGNTYIENQLNQMSLMRKVIYSHTIGQVSIKYKATFIKIFSDLTKQEREELQKAMKGFITKHQR